MAFVDISPPIYVSIPKNNGMTVKMPRHPGAVVPIPSGAQGLPGEPGFSPVVSVEEITGGNRVTITDAEGETSFDVMNGAQGEQGEPGEGVPAGGAQGQVLKKRSNADYDTEFGNLTASDVGALPNTTAIPSKVSDLTNDSGFVNANQAAAAAPVQSVNGRTGDVTTLSNATPSPLGTASHGSANYAARADHVHAMPSADDVGAMSKWKLLWTNASPTSAFAAQTLTVPWENYDFLVIQAYYNYDQHGNAFMRTMFIETNRISESWQYPHNYEIIAEQGNGGGGKATRKLTFGTGTITIAQGMINGSAVNTAAVPCDIYGIKGIQSL